MRQCSGNLTAGRQLAQAAAQWELWGRGLPLVLALNLLCAGSEGLHGAAAPAVGVTRHPWVGSRMRSGDRKCDVPLPQ